MKRPFYKTLMLLVFVGISFTSCMEDNLSVEETITINYKQDRQLFNDDLIISFTDVIDSRCPPNASCISVGQAQVTLAYQIGVEKPESIELVLNAENEEQSTIVVDNYAITLKKVLPYPGTTPTIFESKENYSITLLIRRKKLS